MMHVFDSHTEGEPTRFIVEGGPDLGTGPLVERRERFRTEFDVFRRFAVNEPRGTDALVGALMTPPVDPTCAAGLIFFNNVGYLGMCGHATIGSAVTLHHMGRLPLGTHRFETPVGIVTVDLLDAHTARIENVPSYRHLAGVTVDVPGIGPVTGDVAWGGNWFFLTEFCPLPLTPAHVGGLTRAAQAISDALAASGITGPDGEAVDHIEMFGAPHESTAHSRNFVLCPGGAYDRSPCGTGTSAKLACLAAAGKLAPDVDWVQESVVDSRFTARYRLDAAGHVLPSITGRAYVTAECHLLRDPNDPFADGIAT
jgi:4-hydroxyproline epimerase